MINSIERSHSNAKAKEKEKAKRKSCRKRDEAIGGDGDGSLKYGYVSILGRKRVMEDPVTVVPPLKLPGGYSFFAAYGGRCRATVVEEACVEKLHRCLEKHTAEMKEEELGWGKVMMECFSGFFEESAPERMMFTAVVVGVEKGEVVLVNCGGSRAVLWSGGVASPLWNECKPDESVEATGGSSNDGAILAAKSQEAGIENDGTAGDGEAERRPEMEVRVRRRNDKSGEEFVIIATDGLWNVVGKEMACELVSKCVGGKIRRLPSEGGGDGGASQAAALLAELAIAKGSKDNITIIVVHLN